MSAVEYATSSEARQNFKEMLDAAAAGRLVIVHRDDAATAVQDAARLQRFLAAVIPSHAVIAAENNGYSVFLEELPIGADGATPDEAITEMIGALRTYAVAWHDVLGNAPNHRDNWGLVQMISLSSDDQLRTWLTGDG
jgi:predicted RNase H-like HicB family nuclease